MAIPLLQALTAGLPLRIEAVCADSAYDSEAFLKFIVANLDAQPVVGAHRRHQPNPEFRVRGPPVICPAQLEMFRRGKITARRTGSPDQQSSCPSYHAPSLPHRFLVSPAAPLKFFHQKGCNYLARLTLSIRS